jgi:hypothetical protein
LGYTPKFKRVDRRTRRAVRELFDSKPYRGSVAEQTVKAERFLSLVAPLYDVATPRVSIQPWIAETGLGRYDADANVIILPKQTIVGLLVQLRQAITTSGGANPARGSSSAADARQWAASVLFASDPKRFESMVKNRTLKFVKVRELTAS